MNMKYLNKRQTTENLFESIRKIDMFKEFSRAISEDLTERENFMIRESISPFVNNIKTKMSNDYGVGHGDNIDYGPENLYYLIEPHNRIYYGPESIFRIYKDDGYYYCNIDFFYYDEPYVGVNEFDDFKELLVYLKLVVTMTYYLWDDLAEVISSINFPMDLTFDDNEMSELLYGGYRVKPKELDIDAGKKKVLKAIKDNPYVKWERKQNI